MSVLGYLALFLAAFFAHGLKRGRSYAELGDDLSDIVLAVIAWNIGEVVAVLERGGTSAPATVTAPPATGASASSGGTNTGARVLAEMHRIGDGKKYRLGAIGPDAYDCSSLIWRAMQNIGVYSGPRFTTATWPLVAKTLNAKRVTTPAVGDVAWWPGHMTVVDSPTSTFGARNPSTGIGTTAIADTSRGRPAPIFYRLP